MSRSVTADDYARPLQDADQKDADESGDEGAPQQQHTSSLHEDPHKRFRSFRTRTISTVAMIGGFLFIIYLGHVPLVFLVFTLQFLMVRELFALARVAQQDRKLPGFRLQQWYFFFVATFYMYLRFIKKNVLVEIANINERELAGYFKLVVKRHTVISYSCYVAGFVAFVLSLRKSSYVYQFGQYTWTHMILLFIFLPSSFFVSNIFEGLIWFLLPSFLIIINDIMAYLAGFFFGRTPLIKLSPKKTWEGFFGGFLGTVILAFFLAKLMSSYKWMTCPRRDLSLGWLDCEPDATFQLAEYKLSDAAELLSPTVVDGIGWLYHCLPASVQPALWEFANRSVWMEPMQMHAMILAMFASIIAPFGGFFASGFKRAFKMKDFGDTIPGHGGVTDRFDCQMMMAMFSYVYYWSFVSAPELSVGDVLSTVFKLSDKQQLELFAKLGNLLMGEGLLPGTVADSLAAMQQLDAT